MCFLKKKWGKSQRKEGAFSSTGELGKERSVWVPGQETLGCPTAPRRHRKVSGRLREAIPLPPTWLSCQNLRDKVPLRRTVQIDKDPRGVGFPKNSSAKTPELGQNHTCNGRPGRNNSFPINVRGPRLQLCTKVRG